MLFGLSFHNSLEWEKEETERRKKENNILLEKEEKAKMETELYHLQRERQNSRKREEDRQKELLLAKMYEIDQEARISMKLASQAHPSDTAKIPFLKKEKRTVQLSEKSFNGFPECDQHEGVSKGENQKHQNVGTTYSNNVTFGNYVPSFGKVSGSTSWLNPKNDTHEEPVKETVGQHSKQEKKANLMEQLFGSNVTPITSSKRNDLLPVGPDKGATVKVKDDQDLFFNERKSFNPKRHRLQHTTNRPALMALDYLEDDVEEIRLQ